MRTCLRSLMQVALPGLQAGMGLGSREKVEEEGLGFAVGQRQATLEWVQLWLEAGPVWQCCFLGVPS